MKFKTKLSNAALLMNGSFKSVINTLGVIVDTDQETITLRKRNWHLIGVNEQVLAFKYIRDIKIDQHVFGADVQINTFNDSISISNIDKNDANKIRDILIQFNKNRGEDSIIFS